MKNTYQPDMSIYAGINVNKLPKEWFPFYVVYKYNSLKSTYIVGFDMDIEAAKLQAELLTHRDICRCEIFGHYPLELLKGE